VARPSRYGAEAGAEAGASARAPYPARLLSAANDNRPSLARRLLPFIAAAALLAAAALALLI
jgi:hypothetical protein